MKMALGMDFLKEIRQRSMVPVIIITANKDDMDIVMGLELGANDYITKPFSLIVLRARVGVQLRTTQPNKNRYEIDDKFLFDFDKMEFYKDGDAMEFTKIEQRLLRLLLENKGATLTRNHLIDQVWSGDSEYVEEHSLTVAMKRLRDKIEDDAANPQYIRTVYGIGYTWEVMG